MMQRALHHLPRHCAKRRRFLPVGGGSRCSKRSSSSEPPEPSVKIVEVGPRDGLQNEATLVSVPDKVALITKLAEAGCRHIEVGSFVNPQKVPAMANTGQVVTALKDAQLLQKFSSLKFSCLVPNVQGLEQALEHTDTIHEIAIFASASETFSQRNLGCSIAESMERYRAVSEMAREKNSDLKIRGYLSCVVACPYEGKIHSSKVAKVAEEMLDDLFVDELSLGDTIGVATPKDTEELLTDVQHAVDEDVMSDKIAVHFHDTYGLALANIYVAMDKFDIRIIDSSVAGLGGCPYAPGASGNVATEDVVYMLQGLGVYTGMDLDKLQGMRMDTGIDLTKLVQVGEFITKNVLHTQSRSKVGHAIMTELAKESSSNKNDEQ